VSGDQTGDPYSSNGLTYTVQARVKHHHHHKFICHNNTNTISLNDKHHFTRYISFIISTQVTKRLASNITLIGIQLLLIFKPFKSCLFWEKTWLKAYLLILERPLVFFSNPQLLWMHAGRSLRVAGRLFFILSLIDVNTVNQEMSFFRAAVQC
jgi:hypothetical protein